LGVWNLICTLSPRRVVLGGGVMEGPGLLAMIRENVRKYLNGYVQSPQILERIEEYIVPPALGSKAGVLGAIALAERLNPGGH
jgi:fructokinase